MGHYWTHTETWEYGLNCVQRIIEEKIDGNSDRNIVC